MIRMRGPIGTANVRTRVSAGVLHWAHQQPLRRLEVLPGSNANPRHHAAPQLRQFEIKQAGQRIELQPLGLVFTCFGEQFEEHVHVWVHRLN